jgi:glycosyltransferase involved in cell wall biosynthesis
MAISGVTASPGQQPTSREKMRIVLIGPGKMEIPPKSWGAVEILIWDYFCHLKEIGHDVHIVNSPNPVEIINQVNDINPDFVHLHYDEYYSVLDKINCPNKAVTSHYGYLEAYAEDRDILNSRLNKLLIKNKLLQRMMIRNRRTQSILSYKKYFDMFVSGRHPIYCLSGRIEDVYRDFGFQGRTFIIPNGARSDLFRFTLKPKYPERSIYLAKIDFRKRQYFYAGIPNLYFAGSIADNRFDERSKYYLGSWSKEFLYDNLTNFANLVLLSDGEAHPLVCCEALMAGLGLVVSEYASANLDLSLPFIDIIPKGKLDDVSYVSNVIADNRRKAILHRKEIRGYAEENFSWSVLVKRYSNHIMEVCEK